MNNKKHLYDLPAGTKIISANHRIWKVVCHDYPYTKLTSGVSTAWVDTVSRVGKIKGGYVIYEEKE